MKNDPLGMTSLGLKCDNPSCDYVDTTANIDDYEKYLNMPCPKCGANLFTQADYDVIKKFDDFRRNPIVKLLTKLFAKKIPPEMIKPVHAHMDGTGWDGLKLTPEDEEKK